MEPENKKFLKKIGLGIKSAREEHGYSLAELAERADLNKGQLSKIERGLNASSILILKKIADALELSIGELCDK